MASTTPLENRFLALNQLRIIATGCSACGLVLLLVTAVFP
jgi:uncharacterized OB-fold protein